MRATGTDGEQPLIDAFLHEFGFALHLTCFIHVRRNIKDKLSECTNPYRRPLSCKIFLVRGLGLFFRKVWWIPVTLKTLTINWSILCSPGKKLRYATHSKYREVHQLVHNPQGRSHKKYNAASYQGGVWSG